MTGEWKRLNESSKNCTDWAGQGRLRRGATPAPHISVWDFRPGLVVRVAQTFKDYDGQEIFAGEVLHLLETSYFFYDGGHTLRFQEKTIRLAGQTDEPIIANEGNAWFQPLAEPSKTP